MDITWWRMPVARVGGICVGWATVLAFFVTIAVCQSAVLGGSTATTVDMLQPVIGMITGAYGIGAALVLVALHDDPHTAAQILIHLPLQLCQRMLMCTILVVVAAIGMALLVWAGLQYWGGF